MKREFTGWHMLTLMCGAFGIIIAVNLTLAWQAVATFPGLEVANSYVASQTFNEERAAQDGLGWTLHTDLTPHHLTLAVTGPNGAPVNPQIITATLGRATSNAHDFAPPLQWNGHDLEAAIDIAPGRWTLWLELQAQDGTRFHRRLPLIAK